MASRWLWNCQSNGIVSGFCIERMAINTLMGISSSGCFAGQPGRLFDMFHRKHSFRVIGKMLGLFCFGCIENFQIRFEYFALLFRRTLFAGIFCSFFNWTLFKIWRHFVKKKHWMDFLRERKRALWNVRDMAETNLKKMHWNIFHPTHLQTSENGREL